MWVTPPPTSTSSSSSSSSSSSAANTHGNCAYSVQKLLQKYRRHRLRVLRKKEYNRLRAMVPSIATKPKVSKVTVIEEAIKYIDQLHCALIARLQTRGLPQALQGLGLPRDIRHIDHSEIRELVRQMLPSSQRQSTSASASACTSSSGVTRECSRNVASYLQRTQRRSKWPRH